MTTARDILRAEYGDSTNMVTPTIMHRVLVRHPESGEIGAAEISMGDGIRMREHEGRGVMPRIYGVSVVWVGADAQTRRTDRGEAFGSQTFHDETPERDWWNTRYSGEGYAAACEYVRTLGGKIR